VSVIKVGFITMQIIRKQANLIIKSIVLTLSFAFIHFSYAQSEPENELIEAPIEPDSELLESDIIPSSETPLPLDQIKTFAEVFTRIKRNYVEPVTDEELLEYAIDGMLGGLDPHSVYLKEERYEELNEGTTGRFGGLGMEVMMEKGFVKVISPIDDSPAAEAGIITGDLIIRIDGETVSGLSLQQATDKMRGEPGTEITITVLREGESDPFDISLERAIVNVKSVKRKMLSDEIGYLRVSQFQSSTTELFRKQLKALRQKKDFSGLIIDLRNNPGGLLNSAISIADAFITDGLLVSTKGRLDENNQAFYATPIDMIEGKPIVVLINGGSASASEIVAGALQDHGRALVLGTESFGKGSVQTVVNVSEKEAIKLTTARYYTPEGKSIQAEGIVPDVVVNQRQFKELKRKFDPVKEGDLPGHLQKENKPEEKSGSSVESSELSKDYQLNEAYNLLKGLVLFNNKKEV